LPPPLDIVSGYFFGPNVNLSGESLSGLHLTSRVYSLAGANLTDATFYDSNLYRLQLTNANLTGAMIADSYIDQVNMTGANMGGLPVGATFGSELRFTGPTTTAALPAGWALQLSGVGPFGVPIPPYRLVRVS
jgi:uncharacterized protein YjbI with pentapeptide repeats